MEVKPLFFDTYLATIKNSVGTRMFQTIWAEVDGVKKDVVLGGELACATFVSSILYIFDLIKDRHATVKSTLRDLEESEWEIISEKRVGCIIVWEEKEYSDGLHEHVGFYIGEDKAVSNDPTERVPKEHHYTYGYSGDTPVRNIRSFWWHPRLENKYFDN